MNLGDLQTSKFLKRADVGPGTLVTIKKLTQENVAKEGAEPEHKAVLWFHELDKPLVLNSTNGQIIAKITGADQNIEKNWLGARIVLFDDPNVSFAGKLVGGIRVRAPKAGAKLPPPPVDINDDIGSDPIPLQDDDLPF